MKKWFQMHLKRLSTHGKAYILNNSANTTALKDINQSEKSLSKRAVCVTGGISVRVCVGKILFATKIQAVGITQQALQSIKSSFQ